MSGNLYKLSVVICTHHREAWLREGLKKLFEQELARPEPVEILVVDNNSPDGTQAVVRELAGVSPWPLRYTFEAKQGLNHARNRGCAEARGAIIAFLDDDVLAERHWLQGMLDVFERFEADAAGGRISPLFIEEPPAWFRGPGMQSELGGVLGELNLGAEAFVVETGRFDAFYGANMAFRREAVEALGGFRTDLGIVAGKRGLSGETEFLARLFERKKRVAWTPHAHVWHRITPLMMTDAYIRRWKFNKGKSVSLSGQSRAPLKPWLVRECAANGLASLFLRCTGRDSKSRQAEYRFWIQWGQILGTLGKK